MALVTLIAMCFAMFMPHGWFGIVLLLPHLAIVISVVLLVRYRRRVTAIICASTYLGLWALTAFYGVQAVRGDMRSKLIRLRYFHPCDHGLLKPLTYDPTLDDSKPHVEPPWHFVGDRRPS